MDVQYRQPGSGVGIVPGQCDSDPSSRDVDDSRPDRLGNIRGPHLGNADNRSVYFEPALRGVVLEPRAPWRDFSWDH